MKSNIFKSFQIIIVIICFSLILKIIFEEEQIKNILFNVNFYKFIPCILISIFITLFYSQLIFKTILLATKIQISSRKWLYIFLNSQFLDTIPFAGFVYKAIRLKKYNLDIKYFLFSYLFIFVFFGIIYLFFFSIDILLLYAIFKNKIYLNFAILFFLLPILIILIIRLVYFLMIKVDLEKKIFLKLKKLIFFIKINIQNKKIIKVFLRYGILIHFFEFLLFLVVVDFLQFNLDIKIIFLIFLVNSIIDFFPLTPKNIGFSELVTGGLLSVIGINFTSGVILKLFIRVSSLISTTILFFLNNIFKDEI